MKILFSIIMIFSCFNVLNAQNIQNEENISFGKHKWNENLFNFPILDIPQIGMFYELNSKNDNPNLLIRMSLPMPPLAILPISVTYANSYGGINAFLLDVTFGTAISESNLETARDLLAMSKEMPIELISEAEARKPFSEAKLQLFLRWPFEFVHNFRFLPLSGWLGFPFSSRGGGVYVLLELAPISWFKSYTDIYENRHFGIGINPGLKFIITKHYEVEIKWENYFNYEGFGYMNSYIGLTFKYRLFDFGYLGIWDMEKWW